MATIVVVEDNPDNVKLFRAVLARDGHRVIEFETGVGLVAALEGIDPDLVLLDLQLPERDGYQVLTDLRAARGRALRVVATTAHSMHMDGPTAVASGFDGFIAKPIDIRRFGSQVAEAITGKAVG